MMRSPALVSDRPRILIVEDDARLATLLSEYLSSQGFPSTSRVVATAPSSASGTKTLPLSSSI